MSRSEQMPLGLFPSCTNPIPLTDKRARGPSSVDVSAVAGSSRDRDAVARAVHEAAPALWTGQRPVSGAAPGRAGGAAVVEVSRPAGGGVDDNNTVCAIVDDRRWPRDRVDHEP